MSTFDGNERWRQHLKNKFNYRMLFPGFSYAVFAVVAVSIIEMFIPTDDHSHSHTQHTQRKVHSTDKTGAATHGKH